MALRRTEAASGGEGELALARQTNVGRHQKPSTISFLLSSIAGGTATFDRGVTTRANQLCSGGKPKMWRRGIRMESWASVVSVERMSIGIPDYTVGHWDNTVAFLFP